MTLSKVKTMVVIVAVVAALALAALMIMKGIKYAMIIGVSTSVGAAVSAYFTRKYYVTKLATPEVVTDA